MYGVYLKKINKRNSEILHGIRASFPNPFWPPLIQAIIHSGQISLAISLSGHLSFRSSVPILRAKGENAFRSVESSSENIHRPPLFR